jgi:hypothetical protein
MRFCTCVAVMTAMQFLSWIRGEPSMQQAHFTRPRTGRRRSPEMDWVSLRSRVFNTTLPERMEDEEVHKRRWQATSDAMGLLHHAAPAPRSRTCRRLVPQVDERFTLRLGSPPDDAWSLQRGRGQAGDCKRDGTTRRQIWGKRGYLTRPIAGLSPLLCFGVYAGEWVEEFNVGDADHFRSQAEHARRTAGRALAPEDKAFWLCLAEDWITLAQELDKQGTLSAAPESAQS